MSDILGKRPVAAGFILALVLQWISPVLLGQKVAESRFNFNFDQVEIRLLAKLVGEMTGQRFVVDDKISGKVTVVTPDQIALQEVFPLFTSVLESSGYSVIEKQGAYHVVPLAVSPSPVAPVIGPNESTAGSGIITKIFKLEHISSVEVKRALEAMVRGSKDGSMAAIGSTNHLIITDTVNSIRLLEKIIVELDQAGASGSVEFVQLQHAAAHDVASQVMAAMSGA